MCAALTDPEIERELCGRWRIRSPRWPPLSSRTTGWRHDHRRVRRREGQGGADAELREALKDRDRSVAVMVEYADFLDQVLGEWGDDPEGERMLRYAADLRVLALIAPEDDQ
jgi:hypothetical protein